MTYNVFGGTLNFAQPTTVLNCMSRVSRATYVIWC